MHKLAYGICNLNHLKAEREWSHNRTPRYGQYLTHAHSHITRAVTAMDGCSVLVNLQLVAKKNVYVNKTNSTNSVYNACIYYLLPLFKGAWQVYSSLSHVSY